MNKYPKQKAWRTRKQTDRRKARGMFFGNEQRLAERRLEVDIDPCKACGSVTSPVDMYGGYIERDLGTFCACCGSVAPDLGVVSDR